jgi:hypothetical protein
MNLNKILIRLAGKTGTLALKKLKKIENMQHTVSRVLATNIMQECNSVQLSEFPIEQKKQKHISKNWWSQSTSY